MASHRSKSLYAIKECSTCGRLYTKECCSIGSLKDKILVPEPDSSPRCARCGTPVDGPSCRGCAFLRKKFDEDLLAYCVENGIFKDFQNTSESSNDNTNVVNALREPCVVNQDPGEKSSQEPPQIDHNCCYECGDSLNGIFCQKCICEFCGKGAHFGYNCPPKDPIISEPEPCYNQNSDCFPHDLQTLPQQYFCCENCGGPHETYQCQPMNQEYFYSHSSGFDQFQPPQFSDAYQTPPVASMEMLHAQTTTLHNPNFETYLGVWGSEVRKKEKAYEDEKYVAVCRYMLSVTCDDEDDCIPLEITPDLPIEEPDNSLKIGDEHLDTIPATKSDEVIKSSVENLVPIPSEFEGISDDTCDVPNCNNNRVNDESDLVEYLVNHDTLIVYSSKIDPIFEEFAGELAHIAPIPPGIVEANFDPNDDTSSDDDDFEDVEYISLEEVNDVDQEEKEFDLEDILQIQDVTLREKLLNVSRLISNIESLKDNPSPVMDSDSSITSLSFSDNSLPEFESFSDHTEETRSGSTTTHANYSLPEYESFHFDNPSLPRPPPEPPDVCLDMLYNDESFEPSGDENIVVSNVEEDDSFTFTIRTFLPFLTYPEVSPLYCSTRSEDLIFDPGIVTFHKPVVWICQISQEISQKRTRERMSDQEAKEIKAEAREIMPQPSTVNCKKPQSTKPNSIIL
ncbi:hypothetical protein Tco_0689594 [Tanacetum coccineum]